MRRQTKRLLLKQRCGLPPPEIAVLKYRRQPRSFHQAFGSGGASLRDPPGRNPEVGRHG